MTKRILDRGRNHLFSVVVLTLALVLVPCALHSASDIQAGTSLVVRVEPEAYFQADSAALWTTAGRMEKLPIFLKVRIRLNNGTSGHLSIFTSRDVAPTAVPLEVETETGIQEITESPILLGTFSQSGSYDQTVVIQRPAPIGDASRPAAVVFRLTSNDGAAVWSRTITLPPDVPPAN